jgi:hypothetical protein
MRAVCMLDHLPCNAKFRWASWSTTGVLMRQCARACAQAQRPRVRAYEEQSAELTSTAKEPSLAHGDLKAMEAEMAALVQERKVQVRARRLRAGFQGFWGQALLGTAFQAASRILLMGNV